MAYIRKRTTGQLDKFGNAVVTYQVVWREPVRDQFGAPTGKTKQTSETFPTERKAKAHQRRVETELESAKGIDPSSAKVKANTPLGTYARQYLDGLVGQIDPTTIERYEQLYLTNIAPVFGSRPVGAITIAEVERFRAQLLAPHPQRSFVTRGKPDPKRQPTPGPCLVTRSPKTVKHIVGTLKRILDVAHDDQAIASNPVVSRRRQTTKRHSGTNAVKFAHRPLTANQVASVCDWIATKGSNGQGNHIYALAVLFAAHTGVRAAELQGLQVRDVTLSDIPGTVGAIRVVRTAARRGGQWVEGTPKSDASSDRVVPLAAWLADELRGYLTTVHPFANKHPHAPLFPGRRSRYSFDWAHPVNAANLYDHYLQPACEALRLNKTLGGTVRFHDLRHTFATMNLSAGEHYMQVSKWLGHSTFVLTLTTYADYINEDEQAAPKVGRGVVDAKNVVPLARKAN